MSMNTLHYLQLTVDWFIHSIMTLNGMKAGVVKRMSMTTLHYLQLAVDWLIHSIMPLN